MPEILDILGIQLIFFFFYKHIKYCVKLAHLKKKILVEELPKQCYKQAKS